MNLYLLERKERGLPLGFLVGAKDAKAARKVAAKFCSTPVAGEVFATSVGSSIRKIGESSSVKEPNVISVLSRS